MKGIVTEYDEYCLFCGRPTEARHHLVYGKGNRTLSEKDGLKIPCCHNCHNMGGCPEPYPWKPNGRDHVKDNRAACLGKT